MIVGNFISGTPLRLCRQYSRWPFHSLQASPRTLAIPKRRNFVSNNSSNGELNGNSQDIVNSTAATTEWKRNHYRKIGEKFQPNMDSSSERTGEKQQEPLQIDNYEDVQPMWREMESRVTRRRSLTLDQRGGVSGRRNVRRSDEDVWLEAGVYDGGSDEDAGEKK